MHQQPTQEEFEELTEKELTEKINKRRQEISQHLQLSKLPPKDQERRAEANVMLAEEMEAEEKAYDQMHLEDKAWYNHLRWTLEQGVEIPPHLNHLRPEEIPLKALKVLWKEQSYNDETGQSEPIPI